MHHFDINGAQKGTVWEDFSPNIIVCFCLVFFFLSYNSSYLWVSDGQFKKNISYFDLEKWSKRGPEFHTCIQNVFGNKKKCSSYFDVVFSLECECVVLLVECQYIFSISYRFRDKLNRNGQKGANFQNLNTFFFILY